MIELHTLGDAMIKVGDREIRPTSPMLFAALLYLCVERGRRVPRTALQELLFPKVDERSGAHSLRQLLYKLRRLGVPCEPKAGSLNVGSDVVDDKDIASPGELTASYISRMHGGILPGYSPDVSLQFTRWLEEYRAGFTASLRHALLDELSLCRSRGDTSATAQLARALLALDPLNDLGTMALAEALALSGQKLAATRLLEAYCAEVGNQPDLSRSSVALKRRISELENSDHSTPLLGRADELAWLMGLMRASAEERPVIAMIWGDTGIGKSRLIREFTNHMRLRNVSVHVAHAREFDMARPFAALTDVLPSLLQRPGALGVSPPVLDALRKAGGSALGSATDREPVRLHDAFGELFASIGSEAPHVVVIENVQWLDDATWQLLLSDSVHTAYPLLFVLTRRLGSTDSRHLSSDLRVLTRRLAPLDAGAAEALFLHSLAQATSVTSDVLTQCLALGQGNPLFLRTLATHVRMGAPTPPSRAALADLFRQRLRLLDGKALLLLRFIAALDKWSTLPRLAAVTGLRGSDILLSLQELADRGLCVQHESTLRCFHELIADVVLDDAATPILMAIWSATAEMLESDGHATHSPLPYWSAAEAWQRAADNRGAVRCLRACATAAQRSGQMSFAASALEKAQDLSYGVAKAGLILETISVADAAFDSTVVLRNAPRVLSIGGVQLDKALRDYLQLAELSALRQQGHTLWRMHSLLEAVALDTSCAVELRLRAARMYFLAAELQLARDQAVALRTRLSDLDDYKGEGAAWTGVEVVYQASFGDASLAVSCGLEALSGISSSQPHRRTAVLQDLAIAQFRNGQVTEAISGLVEAVSLSAALGLFRFQLMGSSILAAFHHALGNKEQFLEWHQRATDMLARFRRKPPGVHMANTLDHALLRDDDLAATSFLAQLSNEAEAKEPYHRRTVLAYSILIAARNHRLDRLSIAPSELVSLELRGRSFCDHDVFIFAQALLAQDRGDSDAALAIIAEYASRWRRERYPLPPYLDSFGRGKLLSAPALMPY